MTHNNRARLSKLSLGLIVALAAAPVFAQSTSAGVGGHVLGADGQPVAGADVTITHTESGTVSRVTTDADGNYSARGLRVGGPYTITATKAGVGTSSENNVFLGLDKVSQIDTQLKNDVSTLGAVTVVGNAGVDTFQSDNKGLSTTVTQRELKAMPSPGRSIQDVARLDPRIVVTDRGDGSISASGQNSRYNNISVDGMSQGDPFGLNSNGLPYIGSPISVDTIEEYNLSTANYDVTSNTVGANINAVTKSGTNEFHGSAYYAYRNADDFVGELNDKKYGAYDRDWTGGLTVGGPLIKDKLFFFASYEQEKTLGIGADSANGLDPSLGDGPSTSNKVSPGDLNRIIDIANNLGLQPGTFSGGAVDLDSKRMLAKIDWNINDSHRASLTYQRTKETQPVVQGNAANAIGLTSYWYTKNSDTKNIVGQFFDDWSDNFSTEAKISYSDFQQVRTVDAQQPQVFVNLGDGGKAPFVDLGEDQFSHYNVLDVKSWKGFLAGTWYQGDHTLKAGFDFQQNKIYNLFGRTQFGAYTFWGIDNFEQGIYNQFQIYQPAPGYTLDDVAARWTYRQVGFFVQDVWQASDNLSLQYGFRYDVPSTNDTPVFNPCFASDPNPAGTGPAGCANGGFGFANNSTINGRRLPQPRFSFNYNFPTEKYKTQLRGGIGLFQSNPPTVWMTNPYQNNGITTSTYTVFNDDQLVPGDGNDLPVFSPDPFNQNIPAAASSQMNVDAVSADFKLPSVWKSSLAFDRELPWLGTVLSAEWQHIEVNEGILYSNINIGAPTGTLPDGRLTFYRTPGQAPLPGDARANANRSFSGTSTLLSNTGNGSSDSFTLSLKKPFANEWFASIAATLSRATEVNPGTSSQASSNYSNNVWVNPNEDVASRSNYAISQRLNLGLSWEHRFFGDYATGIGAFYDGHSGTPYSWTFGNDANGDSYSTDLVYIPNRGDVSFTGSTTPQQIEQFYNYIESDPYLRKHLGDIAGRNEAEASWVNQVDLSFRQELPGFFPGNKAEVRLDIFNFLNMLNSDWGQQQYIGFPYRRTLVNYQGVDADGKYVYSLPTDANGNYQPGTKIIYDAGRDIKTNVVSRWSALLTVRYSF